MAKHIAAAPKRRAREHTGKRKLKLSNKKPSKLKNLQKQEVLGMVNGFTVTRLEPEKLRQKRVFPEFADSPITGAKRVTFACAEETDQDEDSRLNRANTRRTHSARDSSADSLTDLDVSREPKRRRTIESDIVEDAEARKATSSMRHCRPSLQHSTPAEVLDSGCVPSKRVFPRTPKPADRSDTSANNTFEEIPCHNDDGECAVEPKVSLASLFDEEENGGDQVGEISDGGDKNLLNPDDTNAGPQVDHLPDITPAQDQSRKERENSKMEESPNETSENAASTLVSAPKGEADIASEVEVDAAAPGMKETSLDLPENVQPEPASVPQTRADSTTSESPLDAVSISRLTRRDSRVDSDNLEQDDVFKQRRSQIFLDEEEPMEISLIQAASRLSKAPTPSPVDEKQDAAASNDIAPTAAVPLVESTGDADPAVSTESNEGSGGGSAQGVAGTPAAARETVPETTNEQQPAPEVAPTRPDSGTRPIQSSLTAGECDATFEEDEDSEFQALSSRIKKISERDETMESPRLAGKGAEPDKDCLPLDEADSMINSAQSSEGEPSSTLALVSEGDSLTVPESNPADESLAFAAAIPSDQARAMETVPPQQSSGVSNIVQPSSDALVPRTSDVVPSSDALPSPDAISSEAGGASTEGDAANSRQAEVESRKALDDEANVEPVIESGANIPCEKNDVDENKDCQREETGKTDAEARVIELHAADEFPSLLETEIPVPQEPSEAGEPEAEQPKTERLETQGTTIEAPGTDETEIQDPHTDESKINDIKVDERKSPEAEDVVELHQRDASDTEIEKPAASSEAVSDSDTSVRTRDTRSRRPTKASSPLGKATPTTTRKRAVRSKAATETPAAATPRTSRRINAKMPAKPASDEEAEATTIAKAEKTPASRADKTAGAKGKTPKKSAAAPKALKADDDRTKSPTEITEASQAPRTPSRAAGSRKAGGKTPKISRAAAATSSAKVAKSKERSPSDGSTGTVVVAEGSKSAVKTSRASSAASSRRKTIK